ncbi:MAG: cyclomaltodextrinase N-terminal domain-containing protein, partial [Muribaculaceae bacterium]|nr:cyclomaltodextrinase N-terminal domain-containing protein [Muribaculaceae bacterium]
MKRFLISTLAVLSIGCAAAKNEITGVEPPMWWSGMQSKQLQLVVSGPAIRDASVSIDYPGVTIDSIVRPDSPNYQFVYLTLSQEVEPGEMVINFVNGKKKFKHKYQLLKRDMPAADYQGFSSEDALYLMMPDRFADGDESNNSNSTLRYDVAVDRSKPNSRHGGDLAGIRSRLDYLKQLGVTAIWLTPVLENDMPGGSYHGYATTDYYRVDPRFGTNEEYRELIAECHKLGIKVVMDMIFNHCGIAHPWLEDAPMKDWFNSPIDVASLNNQKVDATGGKFSLPDGYKDTNFRLNTNYDPYVSDYDIDRTVNGWFVLGMPDLNQKNPHLMTYLIQNSIWWVEYAKINGIRMDTYPYADMQAMARWNVAVRNEYPNFNIVGESWLEDPAGIAFMQKGNKLNPIDTELPVVMDFPLMLSAQKTFNDETLP